MKRNLVRALGLGGGAVLCAGLLAGPASAATVSEISLYYDGLNVGFAALTLNTNGSQTLEICDYAGSWFEAQINVADANGNSTDQIIDYYDYAGGGCYVRTLGYPIRKFRADWYDASTNYDYGLTNWYEPA
jgi:hypothetical protein